MRCKAPTRRSEFHSHVMVHHAFKAHTVTLPQDGESSSDDSGCTNESSDNEYSYGSDEGTHTTTVGVSNLSLTEGEGGSPRVKLASNSGYDGYTSGGITISNGAGSDTESVTTNRTTAVHSQLRQKAPYYAAASVPNKTSKWAKPPAVST